MLKKKKGDKMSYEDYAFCLYFEDLDEDLQERKIDEYIEYHKDTEAVDGKMSREDAREAIERHFPVYF